MKKSVFFLIFFAFTYANGQMTWSNPYKIVGVEDFFEIKNYRLSTHSVQMKDADKVIHGRFDVFKEGQLGDILEKDLSMTVLLDGENIEVRDMVLHRLSMGRYEFSFRLPMAKKGKKYFLSINHPQVQFKDFEPIEYEGQKVNFIFLIDASGSMQTNDAGDRRVAEINKTIEFYKSVLNRVSVISFSNDAQILWDWKKVGDLSLFSSSLEKIHADGSTNIGLTFSKLYRYLQLKGVKNNEKTEVIFLTDGNSSDIYKDEHLKMKKMGVTFYTIGFGQKGNYNETFLRKIAEDSGGKFFSANEFDIGKVYHQIFGEADLDSRKALYSQALASNELVFLRLLGTSKNTHIVLNHQDEPILYEETDADETKIYLSPLVQGDYSGYIQYEEGGKIKKEAIKFEVKEAKKEFLLESDNNSWSLVKKSVFRIPFVLKNLSNQKRSYNLFTLNQAEFNKSFLLREKNLSLKMGEMKSLSLEVSLPESSEEQEGAYLVLQDGGHFYPVGVSMKKSKQTESVLRLNGQGNGDFFKKGWYWVILLILGLCFSTYVYVAKKTKKGVLL